MAIQAQSHEEKQQLGTLVSLGDEGIPAAAINQSTNQSINQNAQPAMLAGQLTLTHYHVTPEPRRE
jgi:hypothetical protein